MAFFFSAVYSESLYLALSVGLFYAARQGRWALRSACSARSPARPAAPASCCCCRRCDLRVRPARGSRARLPRSRAASRAALQAAQGPAVAGARAGRAAAVHRLPRPRRRRPARRRSTPRTSGAGISPGPTSASWDGLQAAFEGARQLLSLQQRTRLLRGRRRQRVRRRRAQPAAARVPARGDRRRSSACCAALPLAYGAYVIAALALPLSYPVDRAAADVAAALSRRAVPAEHVARARGWPRTRAPRRPALVGSAVLMAFFVAEFATWHWVA